MFRRIFLYLAKQKEFERWLLSHARARRLATQFVAGETLEQALRVARDLNQKAMAATLNHLGENVRTSQGAVAARDAYREILAAIARQQVQSTVAVKLTHLGLEVSEAECLASLKALGEYAQQTGNVVEVDMESSAYTDRTLAVVRELQQVDAPLLVAIQAYLYRSESDVRELLLQGTRIRLCKGAYKEPPAIAFPRKSDVDRNYLRLMQMLLSSGLYHRIATHDPRIIEETCRYANQLGLPKERFEYQMLYGVRRDLQETLVRQGYRVRIYVPFGGEWFPYYMRRLGERPANCWFALKSLLR